MTSPLVYWGLSTSRVLTLEYLPGIKISDVTALRAAGIDTKLVARRATEAYLIQLLQTSFLHSDVHPGNIGIDRTGVQLHPHTVTVAKMHTSKACMHWRSVSCLDSV